MLCQPIGVLRTPYKEISDMPIQPVAARGVFGHVELNPELVEGLTDLDGFSHVIVLYHFHQRTAVRLHVKPFLDNSSHGVFATRAPCRPNPIGLSVLRLHKVVGNQIELEGVDMLDETPLLDIKPYVMDFDRPTGLVVSGWLQAPLAQLKEARSDSRFDSSLQEGEG